MTYKEELCRAMEWLAEKSDVVFLGQSVNYSGNAIFNTLKTISEHKKIELPVFEEMQMGITTGLALDGNIPISIFPRWNFLLLAMNQLINHLDKVNIMSNNGFKTKAIIRTGIGSQRPLHPQHQHIGDFTEEVRKLLPLTDYIHISGNDGQHDQNKGLKGDHEIINILSGIN